MGVQARRLDDVDIRDGGVVVETGGVQRVICMSGVGRALRVQGVLRHHGIPVIVVGVSVDIIIVLVAVVGGVHRAAVRVVCAHETVFGCDCVRVHAHTSEGFVSIVKTEWNRQK